MSYLEHFIRALPKHLKGAITKKMPELGKSLFMSRMKGELFSVVTGTKLSMDSGTSKGDAPSMDTKQMINQMNDVTYSAEQESLFLVAHCNSVRNGSSSVVGDETIHVRAGSKTFFHRDGDGNVVTIVVVPLGAKLASYSEVPSMIGEGNCDYHLVSANCEMRLEKHARKD